MNQFNLPICKRCKLPIAHLDGFTYYVDGSGTTGDGITYCPPDPDFAGEFGEHNPYVDNRTE